MQQRNDFQYAADHLSEFCVYLMGSPLSTEGAWIRFGWSMSAPTGDRKKASICVNIKARKWIDHHPTANMSNADTVERYCGIIDFIKRVKLCDRKCAIKLVKQFREMKEAAHAYQSAIQLFQPV